MSDPAPSPAQPSSRRRLAVAAAIAVAVAAAVLALFAGKGRRPPRLPGDADHALARAADRADACLKCHARSADVPLPASHTGRQDCDSCHLLPRP